MNDTSKQVKGCLTRSVWKLWGWFGITLWLGVTGAVTGNRVGVVQLFDSYESNLIGVEQKNKYNILDNISDIKYLTSLKEQDEYIDSVMIALVAPSQRPGLFANVKQKEDYNDEVQVIQPT